MLNNFTRGICTHIHRAKGHYSDCGQWHTHTRTAHHTFIHSHLIYTVFRSVHLKIVFRRKEKEKNKQTRTRYKMNATTFIGSVGICEREYITGTYRIYCQRCDEYLKPLQMTTRLYFDMLISMQNSCFAAPNGYWMG